MSPRCDTVGERGLSFPGRGGGSIEPGEGGGVDRALWLDPAPPPKRAQLTGLPKSYRDGPPGPRGDPGPGGGGELRSGGGRIQLRKIAEKLRKNCGKLRKIAEKLRKNCDVISGPPVPSRCYSSGQVAQNSQNFTETNSPWTVQLQEAPLDITVELQHEPKAADVVIQFVLPL